MRQVMRTIAEDPKIVVFSSEQMREPVLDDNVDVEVEDEDGVRWTATFFTLENARTLLRRWARTGECGGGLYLWAPDLILVEVVSDDVIRRTVEALRASGEFESAFQRVEEAWSDIVRHARRQPGLRLTKPRENQALAERFARQFVADPDSIWWWDALHEAVRPRSVEYGDGDAWDLIPGMTPERARYVLLVTDDLPYPGGAVCGSLEDLGELVRACRSFSYVVTDEGASFGIFDTPDKVLIHVASPRPQ